MAHTQAPLRSTAASLLWSIASVMLTLAAATAQAQNTPPLRKYVGSPDYPALLKEAAVKAKLQAVVGKQLPALMHSISVTGDMGLVSGAHYRPRQDRRAGARMVCEGVLPLHNEGR